MAYASVEHDVNVFLPEDKISVEEGFVEDLERDAARIIRGYLNGVVDGTEIASWVDPANTPEQIRGVSGRLIAAAYYARRYAEDQDVVPAYAQMLYNQAIATLQGIVSGDIVIDGVDGDLLTGEGDLSRDDFLPNDDSTAKVFRMDLSF